MPVLPYLFGASGWTAVVIAAVLVGIALLGTGAVVGLLSGTSPLKRALRQLGIGYGAAAVRICWVEPLVPPSAEPQTSWRAAVPDHRRPGPVLEDPMLILIQSFIGPQASKLSTTNRCTAAASRSSDPSKRRCALTAFCRSRSTRG